MGPVWALQAHPQAKKACEKAHSIAAEAEARALEKAKKKEAEAQAAATSGSSGPPKSTPPKSTTTSMPSDTPWRDIVKKSPAADPSRLTLIDSSWNGSISPVTNLLDDIAGAPDGKHIVCGVVGKLPAGVDHIVVPDGCTVTVVLNTQVEGATSVKVPVKFADGSQRVTQLFYWQRGRAVDPVAWKPKTVAVPLPQVQTVVLRVGILKYTVSDDDWKRYVAKPQEAFKSLVLSLPSFDKTNLIDVFGVKLRDDGSSITGMIRIKDSIRSTMLQASGASHLLVKDFDSSPGSVKWVARHDGETGSAFLLRARKLAEAEGTCLGLAFSHVLEPP